jgi:hypothetical protein
MKMKHDFWQNSECLNQYLHRFSIQEEYDDGVLEACEICGITKFFRIIEGKVDNVEYMSYHLRQALPPEHEYYDHEHFYDPLTLNVESPYYE